MPNSFPFLWRRWWIYWRGNEAMRGALVEALQELWNKRLADLLAENRLTYTELTHCLGWERYMLDRVRSRQYFLKGGGPPALNYITIGDQLDKEVGQVLPSRRELFTLATEKLLAACHPAAAVQRCACRAYVEYHLQGPDPTTFGELDSQAVERVHRRLGVQFTDVDETASAIISTAEAIDSVYRSLGGRL